MRTYLVIGSNCFTGSHIIDALLHDPESYVIGVSRSPEYRSLFLPYKAQDLSRFSFYQIDVVKEFYKLERLLEEFMPQVVINVAALSEVGLSNERPVEYFDMNTTGVVRLCNYLRGQSYLEQYVHISSAEILGACNHPIDENALFNPSTPYAVSKAAADMYLNVLSKNFDFPVSIVRSTNVYGKHQQLFKIIPRTAINLKMGKRIELHGGGVAKKSFIHVRDVVRGLLTLVEKRVLGTFHFSVDSDQTVSDVVELTCRLMGYDFAEHVVKVGERLGQDSRYALKCEKAKKVLGWEPSVPFDLGVKETIEWIESEWETIQSCPLEYIHHYV